MQALRVAACGFSPGDLWRRSGAFVVPIRTAACSTPQLGEQVCESGLERRYRRPGTYADELDRGPRPIQFRGIGPLGEGSEVAHHPGRVGRVVHGDRDIDIQSGPRLGTSGDRQRTDQGPGSANLVETPADVGQGTFEGVHGRGAGSW